ncbi:hypothetical protein KJ611_00875 [Patescibacteria group bacterium]|nr:hypothetical protein [Patescibacteria group bacterium]MBU1705759.1 hypothetical protein [Patescibacteria group bacterium]
MTLNNIPFELLIEARQYAVQNGLDWKTVDPESLVKMYQEQQTNDR